MIGSRTVRRSLRACAPSFVQPLSSRDEDGTKILECHVDGYPRPDIRWEKDGKTVGKSRRIHMVKSGDKCLLQIRMPQEDDFGQYSCVASNIVGTSSTHIRLGSASPAKKSRDSSPQNLKPTRTTGLRSRSMDRSRDFVEENKNLCSQRSRSRSASRNSKQESTTSTKSKLTTFTNNILKRNDVQNYHRSKSPSPKKQELSKSPSPKKQELSKSPSPKKQELSKSPSPKKQELSKSPSKKQELSKSMEDCRKSRKGFLDKMKIPDIFIHKSDTHLTNGSVKNTDIVLPILNVTLDTESHSNELRVNGNSSPKVSKRKPFIKSESLKDKSPKNEPLKNGSLKNVSPKNVPIKIAFPRSESLKNEILKNKDSRELQVKESENLEQLNKPRGKLASYFKIFDNTNSSAKLKKPQIEKGGSLKVIKQEENKVKAPCDNLESEGFLARFLRRRSFGGERKSPEPAENNSFVSHVTQDSLNSDKKSEDVKHENKETENNENLNKAINSHLNDEKLDKINSSHFHEDSQKVQILPDVVNACSVMDCYIENDITSKECAKNTLNENTEVLDTKDTHLSDSTNSHSTEENTAIELTPSTENAEVFSPQELVPTEESRSIPSISVQEISETDIYAFSKEADEVISIKEEQPSDTLECCIENSDIDKQCEGTISYSKPLNVERCEDLLESATQREALESDFQRVSSPIESPARIIKGPQSVTVLRGESVTLAISFTGEPVPNVIWMKGGRVLRCSEDGRLSILEGREMSVVTVNEVTADDSGKYVVCAENEGGGDSRFASVAVVGFPEPPGGEPTASEFTDHSLVLSWYGSMYDGGSVVTGYQVEMCTLPDKKWHKVTSSVNTSCTVQGLSMGQRYIFRVRAENRYGVSHPSKESQIICLNDYLQYDTSSDEEPEDVPENAVTIENGTHFAERFDLKEEVGKGRFGTVYRCVELSSGRARAAKIIRCLKMKDKEKVRQEIEIMSRLHHPKLMQVLAAFESGKNMIMVMEFISGGELFERVIADDFVLTEHDCILFMRQICDGVAYMHKNNILHLDLKPENILCKTRTSHKIKIIDFGLAREYNSSDNLRILFGTPEFVAPEVLNYEPVSPASDMWSVGVICYVLLSGLSPFMGDNDTETFANITRAEMDFDDDAFDEISQDAKDFISGLLVKKIKGRMSAEECLNHPWLATPRLIQKRPLSTEKLKRFIIRRKWQKSGTAIRALGRMVSLSRSSLGSSCDSYSPVGSPTSSRSRTSLASRSETADSGDSEVFSR